MYCNIHEAGWMRENALLLLKLFLISVIFQGWVKKNTAMWQLAGDKGPG